MSPLRVYFDATDAPRTPLDQAIEYLLAALIVFCPFAFGAVEGWSEQVVVALAAVIAVCLGLKLILRRDARFVTSWAYLPMALFLLLVVVQLIPMPAAVIRALSPNSARLRTELLSDLPNASNVLRRMTLTFYSEPGRRQLAMLVSVVTVFVAVLNVYQRVEPIRRLLATIAIVGGAVAALALAQVFTQAGGIYWRVPASTPIVTSGPFVNRSHFCQFMNLSMGAALALMLLQWQRFVRQRDQRPSFVDAVQNLYGPGLWTVPLLTLMLMAGGASIVMSLSRGGVLSMIAAGVITVPVLISRTRARGVGWLIALVVLIVFAFVSWAGANVVYQRMASVTNPEAEGQRLQMLKDLAAGAWRQYPVLGTGLGTYQFVFPMFDRSTFGYLATHAEDEYAQVMTETGGMGLAMVLLFLGVVAVKYFRCVRGRMSRSGSGAIAIGVGYGVIAILIHSLSDFGQHVPANAMLTAICCALIIAAARIRRREHMIAPPPDVHARPWLRIAAAVAAACVFAITLSDMNQIRRAESAWRGIAPSETYLNRNNWQASTEIYKDLLEHASDASAIRPTDVHYRYWLNVFRTRYLMLLRDTAGDQPAVRTQMTDWSRQIVDELNTCRAICPTYGPAYAQLGWLELYMLGDRRGADHIRRGYELARNDPSTSYIAAQLAADLGDWPAAVERFRRAIKIRGATADEVVRLLVEQYHRPDVALQLAADDEPAMRTLVALLERDNAAPDVLAAARTQQLALLRAAADRDDASADVLARMARISADGHDYDNAVKYYRRALTLDYGAAELRLELARALLNQGNRDLALHEAETCLRQRPDWPQAEQFVKQLQSQRQ